jgi:Tfp pilus assembly protein PilF
VALRPGAGAAHNNLGNALRETKDPDGAVAEYCSALDLDPRQALVHNNLGTALYDKKDLDGAAAAYRQAIRLDPKLALAHNNLGLVLCDKRDLEGAVAEFRQAINLDPGLALGHRNLARALSLHGRFAEARAVLLRCLQRLPQRDPQRQVLSQQLQLCERLAAVDEKLPAVFGGEAEPADAAECLALGQLCQHVKQRHAAAARFYADAFAADPKLAADLRQQDRYNAACSAALAAAGQGADAKGLPDKVCLMLRRQALSWLRADLALYAQQAGGDDPRGEETVRQRLAHWRQDTDLVAVRDKDALDRLPEDERGEWRQLWDDVAALLARAAP